MRARRDIKYGDFLCCPYCKNPRFNTGQKIGGHLSKCYARPLPEKQIIPPEELCDETLQLDFSDDVVTDTFEALSGDFIESQREYLSDECIIYISISFCHL